MPTTKRPTGIAAPRVTPPVFISAHQLAHALIDSGQATTLTEAMLLADQILAANRERNPTPSGPTMRELCLRVAHSRGLSALSPAIVAACKRAARKGGTK